MSWQLALVLLGLFVLIGWCYWLERRYPEPDYTVIEPADVETGTELQERIDIGDTRRFNSARQ